jgi:hypothetical protein
MTNLWTRRVNFVALRTAAQWLSRAALHQVRRGDLESALNNLEALSNLARLERDEYTLVAQMIRVAITGLGMTTTWEALQAPGWTEPQLARLQLAWERVELAEAIEKGMLGERASGTELWRLAREPGSHFSSRVFGTGSGKLTFAEFVGDHVAMPVYRTTWIDGDELFYFKTMQEALGAVRMLSQPHSWAEVQRAWNQPLARLNQLTNWSDQFRYRFSLICIPNFARAISTACRNETERQLAIGAIALRRYKLRTGAWPETLEQLMPQFLPAPPKDLMTGKSLCYRLDSRTGPILYSVGENGLDDGGDPTPPPGGRSGLWEGLDALWPVAVGLPVANPTGSQ